MSGATRREQAEEILDAALAEVYAEPSGTRAIRRFEEAAFVLWKTGREEDARVCLEVARLFEGPAEENAVARAALQRLMAPVLASLDKDSGTGGKSDEAPLIVQP